MKRYLLDTGIAGCFIDCRRGVYERARSEPGTEEAAFEYGRIAAELRRIGRPIGQNDIMIAAIALTLGNCTVATMDSDMSAVMGLSVENWAT